MLIIFGFKIRLKRLEHVRFACPVCGVDRDGAVTEARRWFALFFIPLIPLKVLGRFVACDTCGGRFDEAVLSAPTIAETSDYLAFATRHSAAALVRAAANSPAARSAALVAVRAGGLQYDEDQLDVDAAGSDDAQAIGWLQHVATSLNAYGKESLLDRLAGIALADGSLDPAERALLGSMGDALGMTPAHVMGVLAQAVERAGTGH